MLILLIKFVLKYNVMPKDRKLKRLAKRATKNKLKKASGLYGKANKDKSLVGYSKPVLDTEGNPVVNSKTGRAKTTNVSPNYNRLSHKQLVEQGYNPIYQKGSDAKGMGKKGKIKLGGSVGEKDKPTRIKFPLKTADSSISEYEGLKSGETELVNKKEQSSSKDPETLRDKHIKAGEKLGVNISKKPGEEVKFSEYIENKKLREANKLSEYKKGSQTEKQIDANRTAARRARVLGKVGGRSLYKVLRKKSKQKKK